MKYSCGFRKAAVLLCSSLSFLYCAPAVAGERTDAFTEKLSLKTAYESLSLPGDEKMGMLGLGLSQEVDRHFSVGLQAWSAVRGDRGGYITIGFDGDYHTPLFDGLDLEAGLFAGAGGGRGGKTLSGGGLMLRTYAGLSLETGSLGRIGAGVSYVDFPSGSIHSAQPVVFWTMPLGFSDKKSSGSSDDSVKRMVSVVASQVMVGNSTKTDQGNIQEDFHLLGIEFYNFINKNWYLKLEAEGGAGGGSTGYMQVLAGLGVQVPLAGNLYLNTSLGIGGAGGGSVDTQGGLIVNASSGLQYFLSQGFFAEASAGYLTSAECSLRAFTPSLHLGYCFGGNKKGDGAGSEGPVPLRVRMATQHYFRSAPGWRTHDSEKEVDNLGVQLDYFVSPSAYLTGQALAACTGNAGAYMTGLLGAGLRQNLTPHIFIDGEALLGVAGGGGLAVGSGAMWQGNAGIGYQITPECSVMVTGGRIGAFDGDFRANVLGVSLGYGNR